MIEEETNIFEKIQVQIKGFYDEIGLLSKKNPNDAVNKFKLKFINQLLVKANNLLGDKYKPFEEFEVFDEDDLPSVSDVSIIFEQYLSCLNKLKLDNVEYNNYKWYWKIKGKRSEIKTTQPLRTVL